MKKTIQLIIILILNLFLISDAFAQTPEGINYQAIARNTIGNALANATLDILFIIHDGSATGTVIFTETHTAVIPLFH